jgi:hypothetical protein
VAHLRETHRCDEAHVPGTDYCNFDWLTHKPGSDFSLSIAEADSRIAEIDDFDLSIIVAWR